MRIISHFSWIYIYFAEFFQVHGTYVIFKLGLVTAASFPQSGEICTFSTYPYREFHIKENMKISMKNLLSYH